MTAELPKRVDSESPWGRMWGFVFDERAETMERMTQSVKENLTRGGLESSLSLSSSSSGPTSAGDTSAALQPVPVSPPQGGTNPLNVFSDDSSTVFASLSPHTAQTSLFGSLSVGGARSPPPPPPPLLQSPNTALFLEGDDSNSRLATDTIFHDLESGGGLIISQLERSLSTRKIHVDARTCINCSRCDGASIMSQSEIQGNSIASKCVCGSTADSRGGGSSSLRTGGTNSSYNNDSVNTGNYSTVTQRCSNRKKDQGRFTLAGAQVVKAILAGTSEQDEERDDSQTEEARFLSPGSSSLLSSQRYGSRMEDDSRVTGGQMQRRGNSQQPKARFQSPPRSTSSSSQTQRYSNSGECSGRDPPSNSNSRHSWRIILSSPRDKRTDLTSHHQSAQASISGGRALQQSQQQLKYEDLDGGPSQDSSNTIEEMMTPPQTRAWRQQQQQMLAPHEPVPTDSSETDASTLDVTLLAPFSCAGDNSGSGSGGEKSPKRTIRMSLNIKEGVNRWGFLLTGGASSGKNDEDDTQGPDKKNFSRTSMYSGNRAGRSSHNNSEEDSTTISKGGLELWRSISQGIDGFLDPEFSKCAGMEKGRQDESRQCSSSSSKFTCSDLPDESVASAQERLMEEGEEEPSDDAPTKTPVKDTRIQQLTPISEVPEPTSTTSDSEGSHVRKDNEPRHLSTSILQKQDSKVGPYLPLGLRCIKGNDNTGSAFSPVLSTTGRDAKGCRYLNDKNEEDNSLQLIGYHKLLSSSSSTATQQQSSRTSGAGATSETLLLGKLASSVSADQGEEQELASSKLVSSSYKSWEEDENITSNSNSGSNRSQDDSNAHHPKRRSSSCLRLTKCFGPQVKNPGEAEDKKDDEDVEKEEPVSKLVASMSPTPKWEHVGNFDTKSTEGSRNNNSSCMRLVKYFGKNGNLRKTLSPVYTNVSQGSTQKEKDGNQEFNEDDRVEMFPETRSVHQQQNTREQSADENEYILPQGGLLMKADASSQYDMNTIQSLHKYEYDTGPHMSVCYEEFGTNPRYQIRLVIHASPPAEKVREGLVEYNQVVLKVEASTISYTDCAIRSGAWASEFGIKLPVTPGVDVVGKIYRIDRESSQLYGLKVGDRVASLVKSGGNARYLTVDPSTLVKVSGDVDPAQVACLVETYLHAFQLVHIGHPKAMRYRLDSLRDKTVLVLGEITTSLGRAIACLCALAGCRTIYAPAKERHADAISSMGVKPLTDEPQVWKTSLEGSVDLLIHLQGRLSPTAADRLLCPGTGKLVIATTYSNADDYAPRNFPCTSPRQAFSARKAPLESRLTRYNVFRAWEEDREWIRDDLRYLCFLLEQERICPNVLDRVPLPKVGSAHELLETKRQSGFIVCEPWLVSKSRTVNL